MSLKNIMTPNMGESVSEATVLSIKKKIGESFTDKDTILELETDKINVEVNADSSGILKELFVKEGDVIGPNTILANYQEGQFSEAKIEKSPEQEIKTEAKSSLNSQSSSGPRISPAASHILNNDKTLSGSEIKASGKEGSLITKLDVSNAQKNSDQSSKTPSSSASSVSNSSSAITQNDHSVNQTEVVRMSGLRKTIARRLKEAQNTAAILTTFNEVDMSAASELRKKYQEIFQKKYGVKLGFMSIFARASVLALQELPAVNAEISGDNIIYKNFYNIGVAIGSEKGLVVPILRNVENMGLHQIEIEIGNYAKKTKEGALTPADFAGGTFTISNGGVYGSLMSTPIINPPQSAILGMHSIVERPVVRNGQIVIRPMMYLALSYDHRIIDGKEAVTFLKRIKEYVEDPERMILFV